MKYCFTLPNNGVMGHIYEKEPIIWHRSYKLHKNETEVYDAWKRIQTEFSSEVSVDELKKKKILL